MHGSNQHASNSPAVKALRKPSAVFYYKWRQKGWSCQEVNFEEKTWV